MKVSVNWLKEYTDIDLSVDELVEKIGSQLGAVEEVIDLGAKYKDIVVVKVVSCERHPNADKLSVCKVDDGGEVKKVKRDADGLIQVVCGAPNVKSGMLAAWLPPGASVPSTHDKEPFVLESREIRGQISNGMLASAQELALGEDHSGILEVDIKASPGANFAQLYKLDDHIIDIENKMFTHRPDCFGILGLAREVAGIHHKAFKSPDWYWNRPKFKDAKELDLEINNEIPKLVPRFVAVAMSGVKVTKSPVWMQAWLSRVGIRPINNIVDITNYLMYLTGQPLHAYDYDKVAARSGKVPTLVVRYPKKGEKLRLLSGKNIEPRKDAIMIATDKEPIGVGGIMGGADTEVDENTKNIILECANFDMYSIRRTSMEHGLFTDAVTRFTKGQSPAQNDFVTGYALRLLEQYGDAKQASDVVDPHYSNAFSHWPGIETSTEFINARLGLNLSGKEVKKLLENVEFEVEGGANLIISPPYWRTDLHIKEDVVEEVGRLYGYDKLPLELPRRNITPIGIDDTLLFKQNLRRQLSKLGANEVLTYGFVNGDLLDKTDQDKNQAYQISNALSPQLQYYRMSLTPSLLAHVHANIKAGYGEFALFEINKAHNKPHGLNEEGVPKEYDSLAFAYANDAKKGQPAYYQARKILDDLAGSFSTSFKYSPVDKKLIFPVARPFDLSRSALVQDAKTGSIIGIVGEYKHSVRRALKVPKLTAGFEIGLSEFMNVTGSTDIYAPLSRYPAITQDICFQVKETVTYGELSQAFDSHLHKALSDSQTVKWHPIDIYQSDSIKGSKRVTYRVSLADHSQTLTDQALSNVFEQIAAELEKTFGAIRI